MQWNAEWNRTLREIVIAVKRIGRNWKNSNENYFFHVSGFRAMERKESWRTWGKNHKRLGKVHENSINAKLVRGGCMHFWKEIERENILKFHLNRFSLIFSWFRVWNGLDLSLLKIQVGCLESKTTKQKWRKITLASQLLFFAAVSSHLTCNNQNENSFPSI